MKVMIYFVLEETGETDEDLECRRKSVHPPFPILPKGSVSYLYIFVPRSDTYFTHHGKISDTSLFDHN